MTDESLGKKNVHILVPRGFQRGNLLRPEKGISHDASDTPADGVCMTCKGTGAVPHKVWLSDYVIEDYQIETCKVNTSWTKCSCFRGQWWRSFHPLNVQARLIPHWSAELKKMLVQAKELVQRESGGKYDSAVDTFLKHLEYKKPELSKEAKTLKEMNFGGIIK